MHNSDMRVLYVEDEKYLADAVTYLLKKSGVAVDWAANGNDGLELSLKGNYDCLVLDIMLPGLSGLEILRTLRARQITTPVIMLSALSEVDDKVRALEEGADDYLAKPFKTSELIARLHALVRRPPLPKSRLLKYGDLTYDPDNHTLNQLPLTVKESAIMNLFMQNPGQLLPKERILSYVWGDTANSSYAEVYISYLRKKFKQLGSKVTIKTMRGLGYKIVNKKASK